MTIDLSLSIRVNLNWRGNESRHSGYIEIDWSLPRALLIFKRICILETSLRQPYVWEFGLSVQVVVENIVRGSRTRDLSLTRSDPLYVSCNACHSYTLKHDAFRLNRCWKDFRGFLKVFLNWWVHHWAMRPHNSFGVCRAHTAKVSTLMIFLPRKQKKGQEGQSVWI